MVFVGAFLFIAAALMVGWAAYGLIVQPVEDKLWRYVLGVAGVLFALAGVQAFGQSQKPMVLWEASEQGIRNHADYLGRWQEGTWIPWHRIESMAYRTEISGDSRIPVIWLQLDKVGDSETLVSALKPYPGQAPVAILANGEPSGDDALRQLEALRSRAVHQR